MAFLGQVKNLLDTFERIFFKSGAKVKGNVAEGPYVHCEDLIALFYCDLDLYCVKKTHSESETDRVRDIAWA